MQKIFGWFYFSINLGAFVSTLLTPILLNHPDYGPAWAFGIPGVLMGIATVFFWMGRNTFIHIPAGGTAFFKSFLALRALAHSPRTLCHLPFRGHVLGPVRSDGFGMGSAGRANGSPLPGFRMALVTDSGHQSHHDHGVHPHFQWDQAGRL